MNICVYCSSADGLAEEYYETGKSFGAEIAKRGHSLIYGGYCRGIMAAVAKGVYENGGDVTAVVPKVFDKEGFTYEGCSRVIKTPDMNSRKRIMEQEADAIAVLPGGIGTMDEFFEVLVLITLGEFNKPMGILNTEGCYDLLGELLDKNVEQGFLSSENRKYAKFYKDSSLMLDEFEEHKSATGHPFQPLWDSNSEILILGSFPSVKSREIGFFYGHPQNRFWKVTAAIFEDEMPDTVEAKKRFLLKHHIALWDVIASCDITGSSDSSIKNVVPVDLSRIIENANISSIFINGKTAEKYYKKYMVSDINIPALCLPSTSPANAAWSLEKLIDAWSIIKKG